MAVQDIITVKCFTPASMKGNYLGITLVVSIYFAVYVRFIETYLKFFKKMKNEFI